MINHGQYKIYLKGTRSSVYRNVYTMQDGKDYVKYYGDWIEVVHSASYYVTVDEY